MSKTEGTPHTIYQEKLKELGRMLGFEREGKGLPTPIEGNLDCVWRLEKTKGFLKSEEYYAKTYGLPVVAFEVVYSENAKALRGSLLNMISSKPSLAVFVFLKKSRQKNYPHANLDRTENYIKKLCEEFKSIIRTEIWYEDDVNELYEETAKRISELG